MSKASSCLSRSEWNTLMIMAGTNIQNIIKKIIRKIIPCEIQWNKSVLST
jgi:hypothetical protein